jgi:hypothetical protein
MLNVRQSQMQSMGSANPGRKNVQPCNDTKSWVEIRLLYDDDTPASGIRYKLELPDASIMEGTLDENGSARYDDIVPGTCIVSFPEVHQNEWRVKAG